jgi:hypothetical protein
MPPAIHPTLEDTVCDWLKQNAGEIEKSYGIYLDESIADLIKQTVSAMLHAMKYQSNLIKHNEG